MYRAHVLCKESFDPNSVYSAAREPAAPKPSVFMRPPGGPLPPGGAADQRKAMQLQLMTASEPAAPKEPPPESEFTSDPPSISAFEL